MLANRMTRIASSPTMKGLLAAERLRKQGMDVVDLGAGEPDFPTPEHVKAAAHDAINANFTKYTPNAGTGELRAAICARYKTDYGVDYAESQVIVTAGGKQSLANVALSLFGAGDEVITHSPGWPTIPEQIKLSDATPVIVRAHADDGFTLHADAFIEAITPRTKGIIAQFAVQPHGCADFRGRADEGGTGRRGEGHLGRHRSVLREADLRARAAQPAGRAGARARRSVRHLRLGLEGLLDDRLALWMGDRAQGRHCRLRGAPEPPDVQRLLDHAEGGGCRAHGAAGLRDGDARGIPRPPRPHPRMDHGRSAASRASCPPAPSTSSSNIGEVLSPDGVRTSAEFADRLIEESYVVTTAGEAFDAPGFLRISYANSLERLREAVDRFGAFVQKLEQPVA